MNEREKLIEELLYCYRSLDSIDATLVVDFILSDRRRIVEPLVKFSNRKENFDTFEMDAALAMVETLKNAGL